MRTSSAAFVAALLVQSSTAVTTLTPIPSEICYTSQDSVSPDGPVPTTTEVTTVSNTVTATLTETPEDTFTPDQVTSTSTLFSTTTTTTELAPDTSTWISTTTITATETSYTYPTTTLTETVETQSTIGVTVPTTPGFLPIRDTVPGSSFGQPGQRKRSAGAGLKKKKKAKCSVRPTTTPQLTPVPTPTPTPQPEEPLPPVESFSTLYDVEVTCRSTSTKVDTITITKTASETTTITADPETTTISTMETVTSTVLSTPMPNIVTEVSRTTTTSQRIITGTTITEISTATVVVPAATATAYAQCAANNIADRQNGNPFNNARPITTLGYVPQVAGEAKSTEACCVACAANPRCVFALWYANSACYLYVSTSGTCSADAQPWTVFSSATSPAVYTLMNGNCGRLT